MLYFNERPQQAKIKQVFLVNPWVRQSQTQAKAYLRSYYIKRFLVRRFGKNCCQEKYNLHLLIFKTFINKAEPATILTNKRTL
ncbi:hypothetical protein CPS_0306 [Colwellia psychrerythraea 34H]|uniref:Uncharacterized protein n=1 Tax=Colwellia psychrerythraea (strain 34H / ATCC BAA-681) TaxID=167879 RepID=Q48A41_COLP3|nr:hypothetical protein CPS_0306 [Colwellia psychrerythraea 34H]